MASLVYKIFGEPPGKDAPRVATLRWLRGFYLKPLPLMVVVYVMLVLWVSSPVAFVFAAGGALVWLGGLVSLSLRIRREEQRSPKRGS